MTHARERCGLPFPKYQLRAATGCPFEQRRWAGAAISIALVMAALECNRETLSLQSTSDIVAFSS
jgi:hypothetical protein